MKRLILALFLWSGALFGQGERLVVHEWGTFTSLQDEAGNSIGGLNSDDEALPGFAHDVSGSLIGTRYGKGIELCHPDVTMRLETPVIYFHPKGARPEPVDAEVHFLGGWLTQYYPAALHPAQGDVTGRITRETDGWLSWKGVMLGGTGAGPETAARVWTSPRAVDSALVTTPEGERDKFLFYRGVGIVDSPLRVTRDGGALRIRAQFGFAGAGPQAIQQLWLTEFRSKGLCAFRALPALAIQADGTGEPLMTAAGFSEGEYSAANLGMLRAAMTAALTQEGLYADEAAAVLNTWEGSYFKSGGIRLFFLVPRVWTDHYLPLEISAKSEITRVMVGRIEIVSPRQRNLLTALSRAPREEDYLALGRFRNALVLDEEKRLPSAGLEEFIRKHVREIGGRGF